MTIPLSPTPEQVASAWRLPLDRVPIPDDRPPLCDVWRGKPMHGPRCTREPHEDRVHVSCATFSPKRWTWWVVELF